jgi:hypothetical protein
MHFSDLLLNLKNGQEKTRTKTFLARGNPMFFFSSFFYSIRNHQTIRDYTTRYENERKKKGKATQQQKIKPKTRTKGTILYLKRE